MCKIDTSLLERLRAGDRESFTVLYRRYSAPLYRKIMHMVRNEETAEELLQELFTRVWTRREQIDPQRPFSSFLYTVCVNLVYDHFRHLAKDKKLSARLLASAQTRYTHTEENLIRKERISLVREALQKLPGQRREVYVRCKLHEKSYEEVSRELSISVSTIRDHIVKANRVVKEYLRTHPDFAALWLLGVALYYV